MLSRLNARESTSLTFATVASSASLVLLGLPQDDVHNITRMVFGILFACFGFSYNEITFRFAQRETADEIIAMIKEKGENIEDTQHKIRKLRMGLTRSLLLLPILGWTFTYGTLFWDVLSVFIVIGVILGLVFAKDLIAKYKKNRQLDPES